MQVTPYLRASFRVPANSPRVPDSPQTVDTPTVQRWPGRRLVVIRRDEELLAYDLDRLIGGDDAPAARFAAPWPRVMTGQDAVSPTLDLAVFSGPHALHAVEPGGGTRWRLRHACWAPSCMSLHDAFEEYANERDHRYPDHGSCWISQDGSSVWAHVRTPLPDDAEPVLDEEWLVLGAADGRVLGRVPTGTVAAGSHHIPHPDPAQMGLSVGEGQDGTPLRWGRWDGARLTVSSIGDDDRCLFAVSPDGTRLLTIAHGGEDLQIHRLPDGAVLHEIPAGQLPPDGDADDEACWDYECGFVDDDTVIAESLEEAEGFEEPRHWLIDATRGEVLGRVRYPTTVSESPIALGDGTWLTCGEDPFQLLLWGLTQ